MNTSACEALAVGKLFYSFDEAEKALNELKEKENHMLRVYNSQRVGDYNKKQSSLKHTGQLADVSKFKYTYYSVRCAHYGDSRPRSKGIQPLQRCFAMGCQAKITLSYSKATKCLVVKECTLDHNHRIGENIMKHYPSARKLSVNEKKHVTELISVKANNKHIRDLVVRKYGKLITLKDIHNLKKT